MDVNHMMITFSGIQTDVIDRLKELATKLGEDHATFKLLHNYELKRNKPDVTVFVC